MGIFSDYDIDIDSVKENSGFDVEDGVYQFTIAEADTLDGTPNKPDTTFFYIDYSLEDENGDTAGIKRAWYTLAEDGDTDTKRVKQSMSFLKGDLLRLGLKGSQLADFDGSELVGRTGTLQLKTGAGKNGKQGYQNIRNIRLDDGDEAEEAPAPKKASKPAAKKAAPKKAAEPEPEEGDEDDNPFS